MGKKSLLLKALSFFFTPFLLTGCGPDLGVFEGKDNEEYYNCFGDVKGLYDGGSHSYDVEDSLYNETTYKELTWEDEDDEVKSEEYLYIIIPFKQELLIQAIVLFAYTDINIDLEINCFYFNNESEAPQNIKYLTSPETETVTNPDTGEDEEVPIIYDDPPKEISMTTIKQSFYKEEWNSFALGDFRQRDFVDGKLHATNNGLLYIRFENNSGFNKDTMNSVRFKFINLMVRAVEE